MNHPETCYSHDMENNCIILKWGEPGYYKTDYPKGKYTDEKINGLNEQGGITPQMRNAMECCSIAAQNNPNLDWDSHYEMCMRKGE